MLRILSQRLLLWLGDHTLPFIVLGTGVWLWMRVMADPSVLQLVGLGLYAVFSLLVVIVRSARRG